MTNNNRQIDIIVTDVLKEVENAYYDIPFGNSDYQNLAFMMGSQITPERAYRALGLRLHSRINALKQAKYQKLKTEIDIEEKKYKINHEKTDPFEKRRLEIELIEIEESVSQTNKLINDCIHECNFLYSLFTKFPRYTREEFERGEELHFIELAKRQILGIQSGKETLINITHDKKAFEQAFTMLTNAKPDEYQKIAFEMANKVFNDGSLGNPEDPPEHLRIGNKDEISN
jgi:hypothetical protein